MLLLTGLTICLAIFAHANEDKIVGGEEAEPHSIPFQVT